MVDVFTKAKRSEVMSKIKGRDTGPERNVRSLLHRMGYRYRLHKKSLPGTPDIVLPRFNTVIFVHGCFWHRHEGCPKAYSSKTNIDRWKSKLDKNVQRDRRVQVDLQQLGWTVLTVWECELRHPETLVRRLDASLDYRFVDKPITFSLKFNKTDRRKKAKMVEM